MTECWRSDLETSTGVAVVAGSHQSTHCEKRRPGFHRLEGDVTSRLPESIKDAVVIEAEP